MRKKVGIIKRNIATFLIIAMSINSFGAIVSDNDGSAFITKAEFDALKSSFQSQIDNYNQSIDSKIDGAIASYLAGIKISKELIIDNYYQQWESTLNGGRIRWRKNGSSEDAYFDAKMAAVPFGIFVDMINVNTGNDSWKSSALSAFPHGTWYNDSGFQQYIGLKIYQDCYICDDAGFVSNSARRFSLSQVIRKAIAASQGYGGHPDRATYIYPIESTADGTKCNGGYIEWNYGASRRFNSDWTNLSYTQILNMDVVSWSTDYDANNVENRDLMLFPGSTSQGLDSSVWGTKQPSNGDLLRFAYMGMGSYQSLKTKAVSGGNTSSTAVGTTKTAWSYNQAAAPSMWYRDASVENFNYLNTPTDITAMDWASGAPGCDSGFIRPFYDSVTRGEVWPIKRRFIAVNSVKASVSCANYTLKLKENSQDCMYYCGYVDGLRKKIGTKLGDIKLKWPTNLIGSEVNLANGVPLTKIQKDGKLYITVDAQQAGTLYLNDEKVSNILTDTGTKTFSLSAGMQTVAVGNVEKNKYIYISYNPNGTSTSGYTLTVNECMEIVED